MADGPVVVAAGATTMMDVSDELLKDASRLARAAAVHLDLHRDAMGADLDAVAVAAQVVATDPLTVVLIEGEDHGPLAAFPRDVQVPAGFRRLGRVLRADGGPAVLLDGGGSPPVTGSGWDHFAARTA